MIFFIYSITIDCNFRRMTIYFLNSCRYFWRFSIIFRFHIISLFLQCKGTFSLKKAVEVNEEEKEEEEEEEEVEYEEEEEEEEEDDDE